MSVGITGETTVVLSKAAGMTVALLQADRSGSDITVVGPVTVASHHDSVYRAPSTDLRSRGKRRPSN